jgi:hypothetical protein
MSKFFDFFKKFTLLQFKCGVSRHKHCRGAQDGARVSHAKKLDLQRKITLLFASAGAHCAPLQVSRLRRQTAIYHFQSVMHKKRE